MINIDSTLYKWSFNIESNKASFFIGIDASNKEHIFGFFGSKFATKRNFYGYSEAGIIYSHHDDGYGVDYGTSWRDDCMLIMEINTKENSLGYYINNKYQGIAFKNIDFKNNQFVMAIFINCSSKSIL